MNKRDVINALEASSLPDTAEVIAGSFEELVEIVTNTEYGTIHLGPNDEIPDASYEPSQEQFDYIMRRIDDPLFNKMQTSSDEEWAAIKKILLENGLSA